ncbi:SMI1/KNR4 family protein [Pedobacter sp. KBW06]|uniref:SMI1/KNR4 family protein n=1 Tax=Pedobacter sp. KBW06 TaxID=2153359 RepID=UPI000F5908C1|nr:SMI1/KNR4 family protein [Pedobacter sp. KBW06]RQO67842.1 SMI1/KNR4 family protein [Pedobacter sp. KBW06]
MWYDNLNFYASEPGLNGMPENDFFSRPLTEEEIKLFPHLFELHPDFEDPAKFPVPATLYLPADLAGLLTFSNGGAILSGEREFGYFSLQEIRYYYFAYGFPKYLPDFLPIAFNGGGIFYAYDFSKEGTSPIVAVASGNLSEEDTVVLGYSLAEVLSKSHNIEEDLDQLYPVRELSDTEKTHARLRQELKTLNENRTSGQIDLKTFLLTKKRIEAEMKLVQKS